MTLADRNGHWSNRSGSVSVCRGTRTSPRSMDRRRKIPGGNARNQARHIVNRRHLSHNRGVGAETTAPVTVAQNCHGRRAGAIVIRADRPHADAETRYQIIDRSPARDREEHIGIVETVGQKIHRKPPIGRASRMPYKGICRWSTRLRVLITSAVKSRQPAAERG